MRWAYSIRLTRSKTDVSAHPEYDGSVAGAQSRIDDLEIGCDVEPRRELRLVINLDALLGTLEADQVCDHAILHIDDEIPDSERVVGPARH